MPSFIRVIRGQLQIIKESFIQLFEGALTCQLMPGNQALPSTGANTWVQTPAIYRELHKPVEDSRG